MSGEVTIPGETIIELVQHWATAPGNDTPAFVSVQVNGEKREISRKEVLELATRFASRLNSIGIGKGSIICNTLPNSLERVVCEFGILFSGAASMNGQILRADGEDFLEALKTSRCPVVIVDPNVPRSARHILLSVVPVGCENCVESTALPDLKRLIVCSRDDLNSGNDFISSLRNPQLPEFTAHVSPSDMATVMTTSGSTGYSKLVRFSHSNICHFGKQVKGIEPMAPGTRFINCAPLGWAGGYPQWYLSCGVTRYFLDMHNGPLKDVPAAIWRTIVQEKIEYGFITPMYVNAILTNSPWQNATWKPKILCLAGQPVKKCLLDIIGKLCDAVDINYGITEGNLVSTHRIFDPTSYVDGCAGYAGYGVNIKIVDKDRQAVPQGTTGEILIQSPSLCLGYLNNESASKSSFTGDGWLCTDDAGYMGDDGKLYIEGRQSDSILRGVYILYPGWLEKKMKEFPGVKDIVVVAVPDKVLYNEICACVVVDGVQGVVAGCGNEKPTTSCEDAESFSNVFSKDEVDNRAFVKDVKCSSLASISTESHVTEAKPFSKLDFQKESCVELGENSDKSLSGSVIETRSKPKGLNGSNGKRVNVDLTSKALDKQCPDLVTFEKELREFTSGLQVLNENDAMRLVPKYYVFMDALPLTGTGKLSRKEMRTVAAAALGLTQ